MSDGSEQTIFLNILQLNLHDLGPAIDISELWNNEEICIYTIVERPGKDEILEQIAEHEFIVTSQEDKDELWTVEFSRTPNLEGIRTYTLYVYYNADPFDDWWPEEWENVQFNAFVHLDHVLDFELFEKLLAETDTNLYALDIYAPRNTADEFWEDAADFYEPIDEEGRDEIYYLGGYHHYKLE